MLSFSRPIAFALGATALMAITSTGALADKRLEIAPEIDRFVEEAMTALGGVVGLGVAVYTEDGTYAKGFGLADIDTGEKVSADTAFYIASSTKQFTSLVMSILDERGEIDLDMSLAEFAPDAPFPKSVKPAQVTIRDMLTHTSGIENGPIGFRAAYTGQHNPDVNWSLLAESTVNEAAPLGTFEYTNIGYNILTILSDKQLGVVWQDLLALEIFEPAGMTHTSAYMTKAEQEEWSVARPHYSGFATGVERISLEKSDKTMQSAGGLIMSAKDAVTWMELHIEDGKVGGAQIIPAKAVQATHEKLAEQERTRNYPATHYGLGWNIGTYGDDALLYQFGGFVGFRTHLSFMPERKVGVTVLSNDVPQGGILQDIIANYIYDRLAGKEDAYETHMATVRDEFVPLRDQLFERVKADRENRSKREWTLSQPYEAYTGTYESETWGVIEVSIKDGLPFFTFGNLNAVAEPFTQPDSMRVELVPGRGWVLIFEIDDAGKPLSLTLNGDMRFARR